MTPVQKVNELKRTCGDFPAQSGADIERKSGKALAVAFWVGACSASDEVTPWVHVCLMSGRVEELVEMPS